MDFGKRMKEVRLKRGITLLEVAQKLDKTEATVQRYESGNIQNLKRYDIEKIAKVLKVEPAYLMGWVAETDKISLSSHDYTYFPTAISAGLPLTVGAHTETNSISIPDALMGKYAGQDVILLRANGRSLNKVIPDQSIFAMKETPLENLKNGDIVVYSHNGEYSVKYFYQHDDKLIFKPHTTEEGHFEQHYNVDDEIYIHGKVVIYIVERD